MQWRIVLLKRCFQNSRQSTFHNEEAMFHTRDVCGRQDAVFRDATEK